MPRKERQQSSTGIYHVMLRGWANQRPVPLISTAVKDYDLIYPDSICATTAEALFSNQDTCYFFLIKWKDAKNYSWDGIRAKKLYKKWITTKNKDGDCDRNIRYDY